MRGRLFSSCDFSLQCLLLLRSMGSRVCELQQLFLTGSVAPRPVGSSQTGNQSCVSCTGRQTLHLWATREAPPVIFKQSVCIFCTFTSCLSEVLENKSKAFVCVVCVFLCIKLSLGKLKANKKYSITIIYRSHRVQVRTNRHTEMWNCRLWVCRRSVIKVTRAEL